jgi:hypothetical protein
LEEIGKRRILGEKFPSGHCYQCILVKGPFHPLLTFFRGGIIVIIVSKPEAVVEEYYAAQTCDLLFTTVITKGTLGNG